jgi:hypothetical protein
MPRCPDCHRFVSPDVDNEPEEQSPAEVAEDGTVTASYRIHNDCPDCSTELAETTFDLEAPAPEDVDLEAHQGTDHELTCEVTREERTDRYKTTDRKGNPIKSSRYQPHMFGVEIDVSVSCSCGKGGPNDDGVLYEVTLEDETQSSYMDSMV